MLAPAAEGVGADAETLSAADTLKAKAVPRGAATPAAGSNANSTTDALEYAHTAARSDAGTQRNALSKGDGDFGVGDLEAAALGCSCHTGGAPEIMTGVGARPAAQAVASDQYTRGAAVAATGRWLIRMAQEERAMGSEAVRSTVKCTKGHSQTLGSTCACTQWSEARRGASNFGSGPSGFLSTSAQVDPPDLETLFDKRPCRRLKKCPAP
jgi:hypothetical protein